MTKAYDLSCNKIRESDPKKNRIIAALKRGPLSTTELQKLFHGHLRKDDLNKILRELQINARIEIEKVKTKGKPRMRSGKKGHLQGRCRHTRLRGSETYQEFPHLERRHAGRGGASE